MLVKHILGLRGCLLQAFPSLLLQAEDMFSTNDTEWETWHLWLQGCRSISPCCLYASLSTREVSSWSDKRVVCFLPLSVPWGLGSHVDRRKRGGVWSSAFGVGALLSTCVCDVQQISPAGPLCERKGQFQFCHLGDLETPCQSTFVAVKCSKLGSRFQPECVPGSWSPGGAAHAHQCLAFALWPTHWGFFPGEAHVPKLSKIFSLAHQFSVFVKIIKFWHYLCSNVCSRHTLNLSVLTKKFQPLTFLCWKQTGTLLQSHKSRRWNFQENPKSQKIMYKIIEERTPQSHAYKGMYDLYPSLVVPGTNLEESSIFIAQH